MAEVIEMSTHREKTSLSEHAIPAPTNEAEKASLRLVASLMTFGPMATTQQFDASVRRGGRRSVRAPR
jgi:hypothetical protein